MTEDELFKQFQSEFKTLGEQTDQLPVIASPLAWWCVLSQLQLAFRHPNNTGESRRIAEDVAHQIEARVATLPALQEIARRGWSPQYDEGVRNRTQPSRQVRRAHGQNK